MKKLAPLAALSLVLLGAPASAAELDLTAGGSGSINGAIFTTNDNQSTGTGVIQSFVRLGTNDGSEEGYNATARPVMPDVNTSPSFTRDLLLSEVPEVELSGVAYYEFLLDINQINSDPLLWMNELQIYTRATQITTANTLLSLTSSSLLQYDLDGPGAIDNSVLLNYALNKGSGSGDLFVYIPVSAFADAGAGAYVYLYSQFGLDPNEANDGFEEWAVRSTEPLTVPDGGTTAGLLGLAMLGVGYLRSRKA